MSRTSYYTSGFLSMARRQYAQKTSHIQIIPWPNNPKNETINKILESKQKLASGEILAIVLQKSLPDSAPSPVNAAVHSYGDFVDKATDSIPHTEDFLLGELPRALGMRPLNRPCEINDNTSPVQHEVANNPKAMEKIEPSPDMTYSHGDLELVARVAVRNNNERATILRSADGTKESSITLTPGDILITNAQKTLVGQEAEPKYEPNGNERTWTAKVNLTSDNTTRFKQ